MLHIVSQNEFGVRKWLLRFQTSFLSVSIVAKLLTAELPISQLPPDSPDNGSD